MDPIWRPYLLGQLPGWALAALVAWVLHHAHAIETWLAAALVAVVVLKDLLLFPWMRRFYSAVPATRRIVGQRGVTVTAFGNTGLVRVHGELWQGTSDRPIPEGVPVIVRDVSGLQVRVEAAPPGPSGSGPDAGEQMPC